MELAFYRQIFRKILKFLDNPSSGSRAVAWRTDGQTDRQTYRNDESNRRFSQFCKRERSGRIIGLGVFP